MRKFLTLSYLSSFSALGVATCCVLPMTLMLLGFGGSWIAMFGKIAAASYYVLAGSTVCVAMSWLVAARRGSLQHMKFWLTGSTILTAIAWVVVFNETQINDFLIMQM